jgi:hypothetical protein
MSCVKTLERSLIAASYRFEQFAVPGGRGLRLHPHSLVGCDAPGAGMVQNELLIGAT